MIPELDDILNNSDAVSSCEIGAVIARLKQWNDRCRDMFVDLKHIEFKAVDNDMYIKTGSFDKPIFFKHNPEDPKNPKDIHAIKQFCKFLKVPYNFFIANSSLFREKIVDTWKAALRVKEDSGKCIFRIREAQDNATMRAMLEQTEVPLSNHEIVSLVSESIKEPFHIEFVCGDAKDDLLLHVRFILDKEYDLTIDKKIQIGFSLVCSELGSCPLTVDILLHEKKSATSYISFYGKGSFLKVDYKNMQANNLRSAFPKIVEHITADASDMLDRVRYKISDEKDFIADLECERFIRDYKLSPKYKLALFNQVYASKDEVKNPYDFARQASLVAKDYDTVKRIKIERSIGQYLNLTFSNS